MSGVVEQFKVALHRVPAVAPSSVERPRPPAVSIEQRVCDLRALYAFALYSRSQSFFWPRTVPRAGGG